MRIDADLLRSITPTADDLSRFAPLGLLRSRPYELDRGKAWVLAWLAAVAYLAADQAGAAVRRCGGERSSIVEVDGVEALVVSIGEADVVAFRGTDELADWRHNLHAVPAAGVFGNWDRVHGGYALDVEAVIDLVAAELGDREGRVLYLCGHSSGGSRALIAAAHLVRRFSFRVAGVATYGSPRVGNAAFAAAIEASVPWIVQHQIRGDLVASLPHVGIPWQFWRGMFRPIVYRHAGRIDYLARSGEWVSNPSPLRRLLDRLGLGWLSLRRVLHAHAVGSYAAALRDRVPRIFQ